MTSLVEVMAALFLAAFLAAAANVGLRICSPLRFRWRSATGHDALASAVMLLIDLSSWRAKISQCSPAKGQSALCAWPMLLAQQGLH